MFPVSVKVLSGKVESFLLVNSLYKFSIYLSQQKLLHSSVISLPYELVFTFFLQEITCHNI
jgi:hypothetical protein